MCQDFDNSDLNSSSQHSSQNFKKFTKTYNSRCSLMVTHLTTNLPVSGLSMRWKQDPVYFNKYSYIYLVLEMITCSLRLWFSPKSEFQAVRFGNPILTLETPSTPNTAGLAQNAVSAARESALAGSSLSHLSGGHPNLV
ncbi:hypothetical protein CI102_7878 [Trichoderma harzianum]|nr:hypothetical protein CI102_7878 [Trichoderma harzianum]